MWDQRGILQLRQDGRQNAFRTLENGLVREAHDAKALFFEKPRTAQVCRNFFVRRMSCTVDFDDELYFTTQKISKIGTNRYLTDEFEASQAAAFQLLPEDTFCTRRHAAQAAGTSRFYQADATHVSVFAR